METAVENNDGKDTQKSSCNAKDLPNISGVATFLGAPYTENLSETDIALVGVPIDSGVLFRPGARFGPREIRNQSGMIGRMNHQTKIKPFNCCRIADVGDVAFQNLYNLESSLNEIEAYFSSFAAANVIPIAFGGDHSISYPILKSIGHENPVGLIHFDAHCDTGSDAYNCKFHHGGPFKNAVEMGVLDPKRTIQIGIRGTAEENWTFSYESGMCVIHIEELRKLGLKSVAGKIHDIIGDQPAYISFDVDCLDPAYAPGTGTPEIGGMTSYEAQQLLRSLHGLDIIGGDIVEVAPPFDINGQTALVGANIAFEILCLAADAYTARKRSKKK